MSPLYSVQLSAVESATPLGVSFFAQGESQRVTDTSASEAKPSHGHGQGQGTSRSAAAILFFFGPERGPAHPPATEASLNGVFCLPITHTRLQHAPVLQWASSPFLTPVHRTDREQTEERKKSCCWPLQHAAPSHRPRCGAACRRHSLPASNDRGKKGGGGRES